MSADQITATAAAIVAILGATTAFIVAINKILTELRGSRKELEKNTKLTEETHVMVNSQHDAMVRQQTRSDDALRAADIPIPRNPLLETNVSGTEDTP